MKNVNWTQIIFSTVVFLVAWLFIPSPLHKCPDQVSLPIPPAPYTVAGDTVINYVPVPYIAGNDSGTTVKKEEYYEYAISDSNDIGLINITARAYPYTKNDSLKVDMYIIYGVEPKPMKSMVTKDTVFVPQMVPVPVPAQVAFYEEPAFVIPVTALASVVSTILIINSVK